MWTIREKSIFNTTKGRETLLTGIANNQLSTDLTAILLTN